MKKKPQTEEVVKFKDLWKYFEKISGNKFTVLKSWESDASATFS